MGVCRGARPLQGPGLHGRHAGHGRHLSSLGAAGGQVRLAGNENSINEIAIRIFYLIQSVFYTAGASCLLWCVVWFFLVTDDPEDHPLISEEELKVAKYRASCQFFKPFRIRPRWSNPTGWSAARSSLWRSPFGRSFAAAPSGPSSSPACPATTDSTSSSQRGQTSSGTSSKRTSQRRDFLKCFAIISEMAKYSHKKHL